jgi:hypothetical protein
LTLIEIPSAWNPKPLPNTRLLIISRFQQFRTSINLPNLARPPTKSFFESFVNAPLLVQKSFLMNQDQIRTQNEGLELIKARVLSPNLGKILAMLCR